VGKGLKPKGKGTSKFITEKKKRKFKNPPLRQGTKEVIFKAEKTGVARDRPEVNGIIACFLPLEETTTSNGVSGAKGDAPKTNRGQFMKGEAKPKNRSESR